MKFSLLTGKAQGNVFRLVAITGFLFKDIRHEKQFYHKEHYHELDYHNKPQSTANVHLRKTFFIKIAQTGYQIRIFHVSKNKKT